jgi:hypothetical protein
MDLGMFDKFCPSLKTRAHLEERRIDVRRSDRNNERYVIPMHRRNGWTNKWMQDPKNFYLQVSYYDPDAQYKKVWGSFKRKRGLNLCYSCRRQRHLAKECIGRRPSCLCCKSVDHEGSRLLVYFAKIRGLVVALILPLHTKLSLIWNGSSSNFSSILVLFEWKKWSY